MKSVDIILLTYNAEQFIAKTLESILDNGYAAFRIIVSDDCSSDNTVEIVRRFQARYADQIDLCLNKVNVGVTANTNIALKRSVADIVMFCGHDDLFYSNKIERCVTEFEASPAASLIYHDCDVVVDGHCVMKYSDSHVPMEGAASNYLLYGCFSTGTSVCVRGDLAREIKFNEQIRNTSDFLFFYEVGKRGTIRYVPEVLGAYVRHKSNLTGALQAREDFDSIRASLYILEHYKEDRLAAIINLNWTLLKLFSKNRLHLLFYLVSPLVSALWIVGRKLGKKRIR